MRKGRRASSAAVAFTLSLAVLGACAAPVDARPAAAPAGGSAVLVEGAPAQPAAATRVADAPLPGQRTVELRRFESAALGRSMPYYVYLPPGYESAGRGYPVLYMLHGMGGTFEEWRGYGIFDVADELIRSGDIEPLIIVLPQGDQAYWVDHANGGPAWGRYAAGDLVAEIDARFRTLAHRAHRAIGGLSMGAHGALQLALNHPDAFGVVGAHSLVLRRFGSAPAYFGDRDEYAKRDPMGLIHVRSEIARSLALWIDIGDRDPWVPLAQRFKRELDDLSIAHQWRLQPGDHGAAYWTANLPAYLRFYGAALAPR